MSKDQSELVGAVNESMIKAQVTGRWMAAIWRVENGRLVIDLTSHEFPDGDRLRAGSQLLKLLADQEQPKNLLSDDPLPLAVLKHIADKNAEQLGAIDSDSLRKDYVDDDVQGDGDTIKLENATVEKELEDV